jgi:alanine-glyoxylate transaminase/serine-glyoxylate transaminase/serine-pyruvate transaminase
MTKPIGELNAPTRLMMTPGPCSIDPRVYRALATPLVGHLDPWFRGCMEETQELLRYVFQTQNRITFPLSASGSGGIEASVLNSLEPSDEVMPGVVSLPHGWGHGRAGVRLRVAAAHPGASMNDLTDEQDVDLLAGTACLTGVPIEVTS